MHSEWFWLKNGTFDAETLESTLKALVEEREIGFGRIMAPLRIALSGVAGGPDLYAMMALLGEETVLRRLNKAIEAIG